MNVKTSLNIRNALATSYWWLWCTRVRLSQLYLDGLIGPTKEMPFWCNQCAHPVIKARQFLHKFHSLKIPHLWTVKRSTLERLCDPAFQKATEHHTDWSVRFQVQSMRMRSFHTFSLMHMRVGRTVQLRQKVDLAYMVQILSLPLSVGRQIPGGHAHWNHLRFLVFQNFRN